VIKISILFFDLESELIKNFPDIKIYSIGYKTPESEVEILREWEKTEEKIIDIFLEVIENLPDKSRLVGYNILAFDIPLIIHKAINLGVRAPSDVQSIFFHNLYKVDLCQCVLPTNRYYMRSQKSLEKRLGIETKGCDGKEIPFHYEQGNYDEIELHNKEDVLSTEKIYNYLLDNPYNPFKII